MLNTEIHIIVCRNNDRDFYSIGYNKCHPDVEVNSPLDVKRYRYAVSENSIHVYAVTVDVAHRGLRVYNRGFNRLNDGTFSQLVVNTGGCRYVLDDIVRAQLISKGEVLTDRFHLFVDENAMRNYVFSVMNDFLAGAMKEEVERERKYQESEKSWLALKNKKYKTKLSNEKAHNIYEFITDDDEWWMTLNDETKKQIRAEWEG